MESNSGHDPFDHDRFDVDPEEGFFELEPLAPPGEAGKALIEPPPHRAGFPVALVAGAVAASVLLAGLGWYALRRDPRPPEPPPRSAEAPPAVATATEPVTLIAPAALPPLELPPLDASDEAVRRLVAALSSRPELARWLVGEHLVRRFVAAVDNVAEGAHPRAHLPVRAPSSPFAVEQERGGVVLAESSQRRYDPWIELFESVDPEGSARLYHQLKPLVDRAYQDLGYPGRQFDDVLVAAIGHLLATPSPPARAALERKVSTYRWADPRLEGLSPAQRQLMRTGPGNVERVQSHLRRMATALGIPTERLAVTPRP
jgi:hypothetical protein